MALTPGREPGPFHGARSISAPSKPAFALVPVLPFVPHAARGSRVLSMPRPGPHYLLSRFEVWARHPTQVVLLLFGIAHAGVPLRALDWGMVSLPLTTLLGKPLGLAVGVGLARGIGPPLTEGCGLARGGCRRNHRIGRFRLLALFFATATVGPYSTLSELKMGALISAPQAALAAISRGWPAGDWPIPADFLVMRDQRIGPIRR